MGFGPGVGGFLFDAVVHHQIAADITRRNPGGARGTDEDMRMILTHARAVADGFLGRGGRMGAPGLVGDPFTDQGRQRVQEIKRRGVHPARSRPRHLAQQRAQLDTGTRQRGLPQETPQRQVPRMAPDHPGVIFGHDGALTGHRHLMRAGSQPDQRDVVEVLIIILQFGMGVIEGHRPVDNALALRFLGRQPQPLQRVNHRLRKGIMGGVPDRKGHGAHAWNR